MVNIVFNGTMNIYNDDVIHIYGEGAGIQEGQNRMGAEISQPLVLARYIKKIRSDDY